MDIDKEYVQDNIEYSLDSNHEYFNNVGLNCICKYPKVWLDKEIHALYQENQGGLLKEQPDLLSFLIDCESSTITDTSSSLERGRICRLSLIAYSGINLLVLYVTESDEAIELWDDTDLLASMLRFDYSVSSSDFYIFPFSRSEENGTALFFDKASSCAERAETWLYETLKSITNCTDYLVPEGMIK